MSDPIADLIVRIKNAQAVNKEQVVVPYSKFKEAIAVVMRDNKFLLNVEKKKDETKGRDNLIITFADRKIMHLKRISKPGQKKYTNEKNIPRPLRGFGLVILSTPKGVISGKDARKKRVGGEIICEVW